MRTYPKALLALTTALLSSGIAFTTPASAVTPTTIAGECTPGTYAASADEKNNERNEFSAVGAERYYPRRRLRDTGLVPSHGQLSPAAQSGEGLTEHEVTHGQSTNLSEPNRNVTNPQS